MTNHRDRDCARFFIKKKKNICDQRLSDDWVIRTRRSLRRPIIPEAINARNIRVYYVPDVYAWGEIKSSGSKRKDSSSVCLQSVKVKMQNSCKTWQVANWLVVNSLSLTICMIKIYIDKNLDNQLTEISCIFAWTTYMYFKLSYIT